jgi:hypothetical protein
MDPNLHQTMGVHHLNRVLDYSRFVAEEGRATVHLTQEDWQVVADVLFRMETPREMLPPAIVSFKLTDNGRIIQLDTSDCVIDIDMM